MPDIFYNPRGEEGEIVNRVAKRIELLQRHRKNIGGKDIDKIWKMADEEVSLDEYEDRDLKDWQSKQRGALAFEKINTALSVIVDQNPEVVLEPSHEQWEPKNEFMKALFYYSWMFRNNGPLALSLFTFNLAKYGWSIGRHYHRWEDREIQELIEYDPETNKNSFEKKKIIDFNDPWTEILNPYDCWIDDMAKPDRFAQDWCWRKVYSWEDFQKRYPKSRWRNIGKVQPGGLTIADPKKGEPAPVTEKLIEVLFYENAQQDELHILANRTLLTSNRSPLPYNHKRLSCFYTYWNIRNTNTIYGVGIPEIMRGDNKLIDLIMNMSMDQLILSIYKMFFYSPANDFSEDQYQIEPMKGFPTNDPNAVKFLEIPGPGQEPLQWMEVLQKRVEDSTGITKAIGGEAIGKTAFEARQNLEAGLRRLRFPLRNVEHAFEIEGNLRLDMIQQIYSMPKISHILNPEEYENYKEHMAENPDLYFASEEGMNRVEFRSVPLPFTRNIQGNIEASEEDKVLEITPEMIRWEGELKVKPMSTIVKSPEFEAEKSLRIYNLVAQNPYTDLFNATKRVLRKNQENPKDWLMSEEMIIKRQEEAQQARSMMEGMTEEQPMSSAAKVTRDQNLGFKTPTPGVLSQLFKS